MRRARFREGYLVVSLTWLLAAVYASLPYVLSDDPQLSGPVDAFFEGMSGFTTTGASVVVTPESMDRSLLLWRQLSQWLGGMGIIVLALAVLPRLRIVGTGGVGVAGYAVADTGGDLFVPSCTSSPGLRPALLLAGHVDYAVSPTFRLTAMPVSLQLHPAFAGTREAPVDASGVWLRFGVALGIGADF